MREILFRGKTDPKHRYNHGVSEWIEGSYIHQTEYYGDPVDRHWILTGGEFDMDYYDASLVLPETVSQFTGKYDKDGRKIFEGDIFIYPGYIYSERQYMYKVVWDPEYVGFYAKELSFDCTHIKGDYDYLGNFFNDRCEIVGNIYDNPELLKGE